MTINITESDKNFLKKVLKDFYNKMINIDDLSTFEDTLVKWMKKELGNQDKNPENFFKMMQNHNWLTSLMGFFYQHGIGCDINRNMALELYSLNDDLNNQLHLIKENGKEVDELQDINIIIGKYLLSLFYYKDIILFKRKSIGKSNRFEKFKSIFRKKKFARKIFKS